MSGPPESSARSPDDGQIELAGEFTAAERALLAAQFSRCRVELVCRAAGDPSRALIRWLRLEQTVGRQSTPGPWARGSVPRRAAYVIAPAGAPGVPTLPGARRDSSGSGSGQLELVPVRDAAQLALLLGEVPPDEVLRDVLPEPARAQPFGPLGPLGPLGRLFGGLGRMGGRGRGL
jgi:hypothetical protein